MSIKSIIESARFPVYKSGGYQVSAVDETLTAILEQADVLDADLASSRQDVASLEAEVTELRQSLSVERERLSELEAVISEQASLEAGEGESDSVDERVSELEAVVASLTSALKVASEQASEDENHIAEMEAYADEVEKKNQALRDEVSKVRADAEEAISALAAQVQSAPLPHPSPVVEAITEEVTEFTPVVTVDDAVVDELVVPDAVERSYSFPFPSGDESSSAPVDNDSPNDFGVQPAEFGSFDEVSVGVEADEQPAYVPIPNVDEVTVEDSPEVVSEDVVEVQKRPRLMRRSR